MAIDFPISAPVMVDQRLAPDEFIDMVTSQAEPC